MTHGRENLKRVIKSELTKFQGKVLNHFEYILPHDDGRLDFIKSKVFGDVQDIVRELHVELEKYDIRIFEEYVSHLKVDSNAVVMPQKKR